MKIKSIVWHIRELLLGVGKYKNWLDLSISIVKGKNPTTVILKNGVQVDAPLDNTLLHMVDEIFFKNVYNPIDFPIKNNDIVVDIGANIGVFTLFAARRTQRTVYAFEPFPKNVEFINRNIHNNGLHNTKVYCVAVSDKIGSSKLFLSEISGGHLLFDHNNDGKLEKYANVPTVTLQSIMDDNNLERIDFLKLDCEGSEGSILLSTPKDYLKRIGIIAMEFHDNVSLLKHDDIKSLLENVGFATELKWNGKSPFGYLYGKRS